MCSFGKHWSYFAERDASSASPERGRRLLWVQAGPIRTLAESIMKKREPPTMVIGPEESLQDTGLRSYC